MFKRLVKGYTSLQETDNKTLPCECPKYLTYEVFQISVLTSTET